MDHRCVQRRHHQGQQKSTFVERAILRLPRLLQPAETRLGSLCSVCSLVPLVRAVYWKLQLAVCWCANGVNSDIAFYGVNLTQSLILQKIGFGKGNTPWETLFNTAVGNIIVLAAVS